MVYLFNLVELDMNIVRAELNHVFQILEEDYVDNNYGTLKNIEKIEKQLKSFKNMKIDTL